jgi:hypothetical protein
MRLPSRLLPVLVIASSATAWGWLSMRSPEVAGAEWREAEVAAAPSPTTSRELMPLRAQAPGKGILMEAQGTWLDPPPAQPPLSARGPMPPWSPPYGAAVRPRNPWWLRYGGPGDADHEGRTSRMDALCPLPKSRHGRSGGRPYPPQWEQVNRPPYGGPVTSPPELDLEAPSR